MPQLVLQKAAPLSRMLVLRPRVRSNVVPKLLVGAPHSSPPTKNHSFFRTIFWQVVIAVGPQTVPQTLFRISVPVLLASNAVCPPTMALVATISLLSSEKVDVNKSPSTELRRSWRSFQDESER